MGGVSQPRTLSGRRTTAVLIVLLSSAIPAHADGLDQVRDFNIEEQALDSALIEFSEQAGVQLMVPTELVVGLRSPSIAGQYATDNALVALLDGSELTFQTIGDDTVTLQAADQGGDSDSKNLEHPQPILMAQNQTSQTTTASTRSSEGGTSIVTGKVTDARTGANLKGAKVTIEETGQWTATNNQGEFRLVNVPTGSATLTVSFLGYAGQSIVVGVRGGSTSQNFALRGGSEIEEIVVFGQRSARAQSLNQERTANNVSTVATSDLILSFSGATLSDALRRLPGITFRQDGISGDGTNVIIRGLQPDLNTVKLNNVELPETSGLGRSADLTGILADSVDTITISKTLSAKQDSSGTGGLIEIETKAPLDRPDRFAHFSVEHGWNARELDEVIASGMVSGTFGPNRSFGVSAGVQYRTSENTTNSYGLVLATGQYLPLSPAGTPTISSTSFIDPRTRFPFESGVDGGYPGSLTEFQNSVDAEDTGANLDLQWMIDDHTDLRLSYQRNESERSTATVNTVLFAAQAYTLQPVVALGGEERQALGLTGFIRPSHNYTYRETERQTDIFSFQGRSTTGSLEIDYGAGYSKGQSSSPFTASMTLRGPDTASGVDWSPFISDVAIDPTEGRVLSIFGERIGRNHPFALLTTLGRSALNDPVQHQFRSADVRQGESGENERLSADLNLRKTIDFGVLRAIDVGISYEEAEFSSTGVEGRIDYRPLSGTTVSVTDLGLAFDSDINAFLGRPELSRSIIGATRIADSIRTLGSFATGASPLLNTTTSTFAPQDAGIGTTESEFAPYVQTEFLWREFQLIVGLRFSVFDVEATNVASSLLFLEDFSSVPEYEEANTGVFTGAAEQREILPRFLLNYRPNQDTVVRLGYFESIARPRVDLINQSTFALVYLSPFLSPTFDRPTLQVVRGNPDLKPAKTDNFDLSFERYFQSGGVFKLGAFFKRIENPLRTEFAVGLEALDGFVVPPDPRIPPLDEFYVIASTPVNSRYTEEIWGAELSYEQQFSGLPGLYGGLGIYSNLTYTDAETDEDYVWFTSPTFDENGVIIATQSESITVRDLSSLTSQPRYSGTFGVTYNYGRIDAIVSYTYQDRVRSASFFDFGLQGYVEEIDSLDMRFDYILDVAGSEARLFVEGSDLLKGEREPFSRNGIGGENGAREYSIGAAYRGGRTLRLGVLATFN